MAAASPEEWYRSLPKITRGYLTAALATTVCVQLELISPFLIYLDFDALTGKFELWRLATNFIFFGKFGMGFVFSLFFLVRYGRELEAKRYEGRAADLLWAMMIIGLIQVAIAFVMGSMPFLAQPMLSAIVYLWSREYADQIVSIFGLFNVQAFYFPWVLLGIRVLMGQSPLDDLVGIISGHILYFAEDVQGLSLAAPAFLRDLLDGPAAVPAEARNRNAFGRYAWGGGGQRLGG